MSDEQDVLDEEDSQSEKSDESPPQASPANSELTLSAQESQTHTPRSGTTMPRRRLTRPSHLALGKMPTEHDWTAAIKTNVDWKSLTIPACLPLTSEFCPDKRTLNSEYLEYNYELCIEDDFYYGNEKKSSQDSGKQDR